MQKIAVIAGSFDPITYGHVYVIERALELFDVVHVVIAFNPAKSGMFTYEERKLMINDSVGNPLRVNVTALPKDLMTVTYAKSIGASHVIRGMRNTTDFEFENQLNMVNKIIESGIETLFILPPRQLLEVSSSMVKSLVGLQGWEVVARNYVPDAVMVELSKKADERENK
jgi:pantetheine-phosphate adenylyltransferase